MAKKSDNFLRAWCSQVRQALDEGVELAYEAAELMEELADLITDTSSDDELGDIDAGEYGDDASDAGGPDEGRQEGLLRDESDVGRRVRDRSVSREGLDRTVSRDDADVARASSGDAGRASDLTPTCIRVPGKDGRR